MLILFTPEGAQTLEMSNSIIWFEGDILYSRPTHTPYKQISREQMAVEVQQMKDFIGNKKVAMIAESHPQAESPRKEDRDYIAVQLSEIIKALALITPNAVSRMVTNLFFLFKPPAFPIKMFVNVSDARKWIEATVKKPPSTPVL